MLVDGHLFNADGTAEEDNDSIVKKDPDQDGNHKLARLFELVKLDEATPLAGDSHTSKVATVPSCSGDIKVEVGARTVVVGRKKKDNFTEGAAGSIDWRVCQRVVVHYFFYLQELLYFYVRAESLWFAGRFDCCSSLKAPFGSTE